MTNKKFTNLLLLTNIILSILLFLIFFFESVSLSILNFLSTTEIYYLDMERVLEPVFILSFATLISLIPLTFLKPQVFKTWAIFAIVALPLMALWITSGQETAGFLDILKDRESISIASAVLFVFISYSIFIVRSFQLRNK